MSDAIGTGVSSTFSYDVLDRVTSFTTNLGHRVEYKYGSGALRSIVRKDGSNNELYTHRYDSFDLRGHVTKATLIGPCGTLQSSWDILGRPTSITAPHFEESNFQYDEVGNLMYISRIDPQGRFDSKFTYDALYQLKKEEGLFNETYKHDSLHNRLKKGGSSYNVNNLNQLLSDSQTTFTYDKNGNPIEMVCGDYSKTFTYDALDRLIAEESLMKERSGNKRKLERTEYAYDASHRRIGKRSFHKGNDEYGQCDRYQFLFFNGREVGSRLYGGGKEEFRVLGLGHGAELGATVALELKGKTYCPLNDHRGNICVLLDAQNGSFVEACRYSAFGEEATDDAKISPWRFASKRFDPETGFYFFGRRYYSPKLGRFLTPDPVGFADSPNLYAYVRNNPLTWNDLFGLAESSEGGFWGSVATGYMWAAVQAQVSDDLKFTSQYTGPGSYAHRNEPATVLDNGIVCLSVNNTQLTGEYEEASLEFLIHVDAKGFCDAYGHQNVGHHLGMFWNGIGNTQHQAHESAQSVKMKGGDNCYDVVICHNPTNGLFFDLVESLCQFYGVRTAVDRSLGNKLEAVHEEFKNAGIGAKPEQIAHSQGGMTCQNALIGTSFQKEDLIGRTATFGSPTQLPGAINYAARGDLVPELGKLHSGPGEAAIPCGEHKNPFDAHSFLGESYQDALQDAVKNRGLFSD